jgi:hypothetical protein
LLVSFGAAVERTSSGKDYSCSLRAAQRKEGSVGRCSAAEVARPLVMANVGAVGDEIELYADTHDEDLGGCFCAHHPEILDGLGGISAWELVIALDPQLGAALSDDQLERALVAAQRPPLWVSSQGQMFCLATQPNSGRAPLPPTS